MATIASAIENTKRWLYPGGDNYPAVDFLEGAITDSATSLTTEGRVDRIPAGIIEINSERIWVKEAATTEVVSPVVRGFAGSTATAHSDGDQVIVNPDYYRTDIFDAIKSVIGMLYPWQLYKRNLETTKTIDVVSAVALNALDKEVLSISYEDGTRYRPLPNLHYDVFKDVSPIEIHFYGGLPGAATRIVTKRDFTAPTAEADDMDDLGVPSGLQPYIPMAAAGLLLQQNEPARVDLDELRAQLAAQSVQVGANLNVGQALVETFKRNYVAAERTRLLLDDEPGFQYVT